MRGTDEPAGRSDDDPGLGTARGAARALEPDLRGWFADDPSRAETFTFTAGDLYVDLSKNLINADVLSALVELAEQVGLAERRDAMFAGEHINVTEDRAVLHTALRLPEGRQPGRRRHRCRAPGARGAGQGVRLRRQGAQRRVDWASPASRSRPWSTSASADLILVR